MKDRQQQRDTLTRELAALAQAGQQIDWTKAERELRAKLDDWKGLLRRQVPQARQILKKLLRGPIQFTPSAKGANGIARSRHRLRWTG